MSLHINRFIDKIKSLESKNAKQLTMTIKEAKDLHSDITKILLALAQKRPQESQNNTDEIQKIEIDGGDF